MQTKNKMAISEETDQVFKGVTGDISIDDAGNSRMLVVSNTEGWADTVVWNPYGNEGRQTDGQFRQTCSGGAGGVLKGERCDF